MRITNPATLTNRQIWTGYTSGLLCVMDESRMLVEMARRVHMREKLAATRSQETVEEIKRMFSTYKLNGAGDQCH